MLKRLMTIGASLQFRDAAISFASQDGRSFRIEQNVGPVPALKARLFWPFGRQSFVGAESTVSMPPVDSSTSLTSLSRGQSSMLRGAMA